MLEMIAATGAPSGTGGFVLFITVVAAALSGGVLNVLYQAWRRRKVGPIEDATLVSDLVRKEMSGLQDLLGTYRTEVEVLKRQLEDHRKELSEITRELAKSQLRIAQLEEALRTASARRDELLRELERVRSDREALAVERARLVAEADKLRERVDALEAFARRIHPAEASPD